MTSQDMLERAFALARSGEYASVNDIRVRLRIEKFEQVDVHLSATSLARQLRSLCAEARRAAGE